MRPGSSMVCVAKASRVQLECKMRTKNQCDASSKAAAATASQMSHSPSNHQGERAPTKCLMHIWAYLVCTIVTRQCNCVSKFVDGCNFKRCEGRMFNSRLKTICQIPRGIQGGIPHLSSLQNCKLFETAKLF